MENILLGSKVRFVKPLSDYERKLEFEVTNVNEVTQRILITALNSGLSIAPTELVSIKDVELIN